MDKFFLKSKTVLGAIIATVPMWLPIFGLEASPEQVDAASTAATSVLGNFEALFYSVGAVLAAVGLRNGEGKLKILPGK